MSHWEQHNMKKILFVLPVLLALGAGSLLGQTEDLFYWAQAAPQPPSPPGAPAPPPEQVFERFVTAVQAPGGSYLGIGIGEVSSERAKALKLPEERGIEITRVEEDSPAAKAGLKQGDVVLEYNGQRVEGTEQFVRLVRETPAGRAVKLLINRGGATQTITATVGQHKHQPEVFRWREGQGQWQEDLKRNMERLRENLRELRPQTGIRIMPPDVPGGLLSWRSGVLGVEAESLSTQLAEFFGVKEGVLVRSVSKGSAAEKAGIKAGDVMVKVDNQKVATPGEVTGAIRSARSKKTFPITVVRNRQETTVNVTIEEAAPPSPPARPRWVTGPERPSPPQPKQYFASPARVRTVDSIPL
jgi:serine protease Do